MPIENRLKATTFNLDDPARITTAEIVTMARANVGQLWQDDGCTDFVWAITNIAGAPFFDVRSPNQLLVSNDPLRPKDIDYFVPHREDWGTGHPGPDEPTDQWEVVDLSSLGPTIQRGELEQVLRPGDVVRAYTDNSEGPGKGHSFIVTQRIVGTGGAITIKVVDNVDGIPKNPLTNKITEHELYQFPYINAYLDETKYVYVSRLIEAIIIAGDDNGNTRSGGNGAELIIGNGGSDTLTGNGGNDTIFGDSNVQTLINSGADVLWGGAGNDTLNGGAGSDTAGGGAGNDTLIGEVGNDSLTGGVDNDQLFGGAGIDRLAGGAGVDSLGGGDHNDTITGGTENDSIDGGAGNDRAVFAGSSTGYQFTVVGTTVTVAGVDGVDRLTGVERFVFADRSFTLGELLNDRPTADDDGASVSEAGLLTGNVLSNDDDPDGDSLVVSAVNGFAANVGVQRALASGALLTVNVDGTFTYDPYGAFDFLTVGQTATETFSYTVSDGRGGIDTATVTITVEGASTVAEAWMDGFGGYKLLDPEGQAGINFGFAVGLSQNGELLAGGAPSFGGSGPGAGYVRPFIDGADGYGDQLQTSLRPAAEDEAALDWPGDVLAVAGDGQSVVVGYYRDDDLARDSGSLLIFDRSGSAWGRAEVNGPTGVSLFGATVDISADGDHIVVGNGGGYVSVLSRGSGWQPEGVISGPSGVFQFGWDVAISNDGTTVVASGGSGPEESLAFWKNVGGTWIDQGPISFTGLGAMSPWFELSGDGETFVRVSDDGRSAYVFEAGSSGFTHVATLTITDPDEGGYLFGANSLGISDDGSVILIGDPSNDREGTDTGAAFLFAAGGDGWSGTETPILTIRPDNPTVGQSFGEAIALSGDGRIAAIGVRRDDELGDDAGAVYILGPNVTGDDFLT